MADMLDTYEFRERGRGEQYPWDKWLDGSIWALARGQDFDCTISAIRSGAYLAATSRGMKVRTANPDPFTLVVQAYSVADNE